MSVLQAIIIAIVEGLTEFLPISSTGHMVFTASLLGIEKQEFTKLFIESIQFGAIISVLILYWKKFVNFKSISFYIKLLIAFLPAVAVGILLKDYIDKMLETPLFIAVITLAGGIILIFIDRFFKNATLDTEEKITKKNALIIGLFQVLAVIFPGLSRSAATIIGGMQQKLTRKNAAEFSFFLAVPTLAGAFLKSTYDAYSHNPELLNTHNIQLLAIGNIVAFVVALLAIKGFIRFLTKFGFRWFGYYRVVLGSIIIIFILLGYQLNIV
jgi:undecaprenyl-diphosphatase